MAVGEPYPSSLIGKSLGGQAKFFSAADAVIYINGIKWPMATSISWSMSETRTPLYGYNDRLFRSVTKGRVQISGVVQGNFLFKGFLELLTLEKEKRVSELNRIIEEDPVISAKIKASRKKRGEEMPSNHILESDIISFIQEQASNVTLTNAEKEKRLSDLAGFLEGRFYPPSPEAAINPQIIQNRFDMDVFYSNHNKVDPSLGTGQLGRINILSESFKDCYIVGKSKSIRAEVGGPDGGGSPILETYEFIARKLV